MEEKTILYIILILIVVLVTYLIVKDFVITQAQGICINETTGEVTGSYVETRIIRARRFCPC